MCFGGGGVSQPQIVYQGPSEQDIAANRAAMAQYQTQMQEQQAAFASQLQQQIDAANSETQRLQQQYSADLSAAERAAAGQVAGAKGKAAADIASAGAAGASQQVGAYAVTATQSAPTEGAQTTAAVEKKEKPKSTLKISSAALPSTAGTGLNIGV